MTPLTTSTAEYPEATTKWLEATLSDRPVLWVGAGVSIGAGLPSTRQLVDAMVKRASHEAEIDPEQPFYAVADAFITTLGWGALQELLQAEIGRHTPTITPTLRTIARLAPKLAAIVTTNYDNALETALSQAGQGALVISPERNEHLRGSGEIRLIKLHGSVEDWDQVVLSGTSYTEFFTRHPFWRGQLDDLLRKNPVLFVGCSLQDPRIVDWLGGIPPEWRRGLKPWRALMTRPDWDRLGEWDGGRAARIFAASTLKTYFLRDHGHLDTLMEACGSEAAAEPLTAASRPSVGGAAPAVLAPTPAPSRNARKPRATKRWLVLVLTCPIRGVPADVTDEEVDEALRPHEAGERLRIALPGVVDGNFAPVAAQLRRAFEGFRERLKQQSFDRVGVFAIGPIPVLALLGQLLGNKGGSVTLFQKHREPVATWRWQSNRAADCNFRPSLVDPSQLPVRDVVVKLAISAVVKDTQYADILAGVPYASYEIVVRSPNRSFLQTENQLTSFRRAFRGLLDDIVNHHGSQARIHLFAAVPVAVAVECTRDLHSFAAFHIYEQSVDDNRTYIPGIDLFARPRSEQPEQTGNAQRRKLAARGITFGLREIPADPSLGHPATFWMMETPVTRALWNAVWAASPGHPLQQNSSGDPTLPVVSVSWQDARQFADKLTAAVTPRTQGTFRLPTEAEWAHAATGTNTNGHFAGSGIHGPRPVGAATLDGRGLSDLLGNVWEWCEDSWTPESGEPDSRYLHHRVVRGGGWDTPREIVTSKTRSHADPATLDPARGFRLVISARTPAASVAGPESNAHPSESGRGEAPAHLPLSKSHPPPTNSTITFTGPTQVQIVQAGSGVQHNRLVVYGVTPKHRRDGTEDA